MENPSRSPKGWMVALRIKQHVLTQNLQTYRVELASVYNVPIDWWKIKPLFSNISFNVKFVAFVVSEGCLIVSSSFSLSLQGKNCIQCFYIGAWRSSWNCQMMLFYIHKLEYLEWIYSSCDLNSSASSNKVTDR